MLHPSTDSGLSGRVLAYGLCRRGLAVLRRGRRTVGFFAEPQLRDPFLGTALKFTPPPKKNRVRIRIIRIRIIIKEDRKEERESSRRQANEKQSL